MQHLVDENRQENSSSMAPPDLFPRESEIEHPLKRKRTESPECEVPDMSPFDHESESMSVDSFDEIYESTSREPLASTDNDEVEVSRANITSFSSNEATESASREPPVFSDSNGTQAMHEVGTSVSGAEVSRKDHDDEKTNATQDVFNGSSSLSATTSLDLAERIKGYCLLELINEQSTSGMVGKIIIAQEHLGRFINYISPGAYSSVTKVDFATLDQHIIKPISVYGSRSEIVRLLLEIGAVNDEIASLLQTSNSRMSANAKPTLTSGLYIFEAPSIVEGVKQFYVVYWPEETTWDDNAAPAVVKNRITFMRYLTKITDQILSLISPEHAQALVLRETTAGQEPTRDEDDDDSDDRIFNFKVSKTNEQDEGVTVHPGFDLCNAEIKALEDCPQASLEENMLQPVLIRSETQLAFMTASYKPEVLKSRRFTGNKTAVALKSFVKQGDKLSLSKELTDDALEILTSHGLEDRYPQAVTEWRQRNTSFDDQIDNNRQQTLDKTRSQVQLDQSRTKAALEFVALQKVLEIFSPFFNDLELASNATWNLGKAEISSCSMHLENLQALYPKIKDVQGQELPKIKSHNMSSNKPYHRLKNRFLTVRHLLKMNDGLSNAEKQRLVDAITEEGSLEDALPAVILENFNGTLGGIGGGFGRAVKKMSNIMFTTDSDPSKEIINHARQVASSDNKSDLVFLQELPMACDSEPLLLKATLQIGEIIRGELKRRITVFVDKVYQSIEQIQFDHLQSELRREAEVQRKHRRSSSRLQLIQEINETDNSTSSVGRTLETLNVIRGNYFSATKTYEIRGTEEFMTSAHLSYAIHVLAFTGDDKQKLLEMGSDCIPTPLFTPHVPTFGVPVGMRVRHIQIFENNRCLLILENLSGDLKVFLEELHGLREAIDRDRTKATFNHTKLDPDVVFAVDEARGLLAIVSSGGENACRLHVFRITLIDQSPSVTGRGTPITLHSWHGSALRITKACFVTGAEEILLVDGLTARIYSLVTQQYRPAPLQLITEPIAVFSSPDGACLLAIEQDNQRSGVRTYHWESFGSKEGNFFELPAESISFGVTSLVRRHIVHLLTISSQHHAFRSMSLRITRRSSEFKFRAQDELHKTSSENLNDTQHNCILDCHSAVWTRFPVVPAIKRSTIRSEGREPGWLQFVTSANADHELFAKYFHDLITLFERNTRKPFDEGLRQRDVFGSGTIDRTRPSSRFCTGEWLIELLCLIPIQISVVRDNRFIPLRDGVFSPDLERSLLGADLHQVVESLTFGWYESLLGSYYIGKRVKVVSSMGQQSVGKSYMINHFTDSSFQGSAMRTTEGCWMSLTPTDDCLVISLDFEGLDSIERSAQEDTLLVLFNTAISNLVLFRNNFALSRDLAGSFQSFQSSSSVLDPAANPTLFQGMLAIIVKDVIDADSTEIVKEFSQKLHNIVTQEQDSNFITRLHRGSLGIIPWPVIESKKFYTMFGKLRKIFHEQPVTHPGAGVFLSTLKTLMGKLKINDWGALDQNLANLRVQKLESMLPVAFAYGLADNETEEPLKNIDEDTVIPHGKDSPAVFYLPQLGDPAGAPQRLSVLSATFSSKCHRQEAQWAVDLSSHLNSLIENRIQHVGDWLEENTARFSSHAEVIALQRKFQEMVVVLKAGLQLCNMGCEQCRLACIEPRYHEGGHDCHTNHICAFTCHYCDLTCRLAAGHDSHHLCSASAHLCGKQCDLSDKRGCLGGCTKACYCNSLVKELILTHEHQTVNHEDEAHFCSTRNHECGEACALNGVRLSNGTRYTCPGKCIIPCDVDHEQHACEDKSCPITCQLCKRLCSLNHLHGMCDELHLCGEEHPCKALCGQQGVCEISTLPHSVETTFRGTVDTFQYTKYSQVVKRLQCALTIPSDALEHDGEHRHSEAQDIFHFCDVRCCNCDYICTLPYGHAQKEHETSHGSCAKTQWAIEGPPGSIFELGGHKYAANDSGAPMLCNMICASIGRHVHVDYCRTQDTLCEGPQQQHINLVMLPQVKKPKDFITHELYWNRTGFKDPYTREEQVDFSKCDHMCGGPEHEATQNAPAQPSYCILPMFHAPQPLAQSPSAQGYVSTNGHAFSCKNPSIGHQAFHVIFVIDRSGSMGYDDRRPQMGLAASGHITQQGYTNRLGAVYSALYSFWTARAAAVATLASQGGSLPRRDSYSVIIFDHDATVALENDFTHSPDQLLDILLPHGPRGGTNFTGALDEAHMVLERNWSTERSPVVIFLSDGECSVRDDTVYDLVQKSQALGTSLCFHAVSFGPDGNSFYLRRMKDIAAEVHARGPRDALAAPGAGPCSYTQAIDTIRLAETFLGFAESLQKPRASLLRG